MKNESKATLAAHLAEIMAVWNKIEAEAKAKFPNANKEEIYQICSQAMNHALGIKRRNRESEPPSLALRQK